MELLDEIVCVKDKTEDYCYAETTSEDRQAVSSSVFTSLELYSQGTTSKSVAATDAVAQSSDDDHLFGKDGHVVLSSSYEDIYIGTKLPGDEPQDDEADIVDVSDIGDRFDARPRGSRSVNQSGGRSSSFENLYEIHRKESADRGLVEMADDSVIASIQQWQVKDSSEDLSEKDSMLASIPSVSWEAQRSCPIDITVESGLDRVGQTAGYSRTTALRSSAHLLQHSMSYDMEVGRRHHRISSGSSLDGDDEGASDDCQRERNATSGIRNGCRCTV